MHSRFGFGTLRESLWLPFAVGLLAGALLGLYEYFVGPLFAVGSAAGWTLPLVAFVFLMLMGTGVSLALARGLLARDDSVTRHARFLLILALAMLVGGFAALAGSLLARGPLALDPSSPVIWIVAVWVAQLALLSARLVLDMAGWRSRSDLPFCGAMLLLAAAAAIVIGAAFGTVLDRPDFQGALLSMITFTSALVSGAGAIVLMRPQHAAGNTAGKIFRRAGLLLSALLLVRIAYETHSPAVASLGWTSISMLAPFVIAATLLPLAPRLLAMLGIVAVFWVQYSFMLTGQVIDFGNSTPGFAAAGPEPSTVPDVLTLFLGIGVTAVLIWLGQRFLGRDRQSPTP